MMYARNKKALFDYTVLEKYEAGIVLKGLETKQIRNSKVQLKGSFCKFFKDELFLMNAHITTPETADKWQQYKENRPIKLLLHRKQLNKLQSQVEQDGLSLVVLDMYRNDKNKIKCTLSLVKGKKLYDKRETIKQRDLERANNVD